MKVYKYCNIVGERITEVCIEMDKKGALGWKFVSHQIVKMRTELFHVIIMEKEKEVEPPKQEEECGEHTN